MTVLSTIDQGPRLKPVSIQVIPANAGFFTVYAYEDERRFKLGEPVIAWRVETYEHTAAGERSSSCIPLTVDGTVPENCIGVQNPDMSVTVFADSHYASLAALQKDRYPEL